MANQESTAVQKTIQQQQQQAAAEKAAVAVQSQSNAAPAAVAEGTKDESVKQPAQAPAVINRGVQPSAPAARAETIAQKQNLAQGKTAVSAVAGSRTAEMLKNLKKPGTTQADPAEVVGDLLKSVSAAYQYPIVRLYDYIKRMDPAKAENTKTGAVEQAALYHAITNIINNQADHFTPLFTALLRLFNTYNTPRDVFHDFNCSRFMEVVNLNSDERKAFNNLVCFLKAFANPETRAIAKRNVDHVRLLALGLNEEGRQRVMAYLEL